MVAAAGNLALDENGTVSLRSQTVLDVSIRCSGPTPEDAVKTKPK